MIYLLLGGLLLMLMIAPQLVVLHTLKKYNVHNENIPGSGGQFAAHLLNRLDLANTVSVEEAEQGDHYDPQTRTVRLHKNHFRQHSLAAMVIAAHEVGHAIQDAENYPWLTRRIQLTRLALPVQKVAPITLALAPALLAITRSPALAFLTLSIGLLAIGLSVLIHLITLPAEWDASFNKALPILVSGNYLTHAEDYAAARTILKAAALTYVAQSLFNLLNIAYWLRLLKP